MFLPLALLREPNGTFDFSLSTNVSFLRDLRCQYAPCRTAGGSMLLAHRMRAAWQGTLCKAMMWSIWQRPGWVVGRYQVFRILRAKANTTALSWVLVKTGFRFLVKRDNAGRYHVKGQLTVGLESIIENWCAELELESFKVIIVLEYFEPIPQAWPLGRNTKE